METAVTNNQKPSFWLRLFKTLGKAWLVVTSAVGSFVLIALLLLFLLASSFSGPLNNPSLSHRVIRTGGVDKIAILPVTGVISDGSESDPFSYDPTALTASDIVAILEEIKADDSIKGVILQINSPGGAVVASDEIYTHALDLRQTKPVVAVLGDTAASGGYYVASAANKIIANPATITGSIGVIMELPKLSGLYDKIGIEMRTFKTGEFKDIGSPNRDLTTSENQILNSVLNDAYQQFIHAVVKGRSLPEDKVRQLADGRIFSGIQAKENGLVDELGNFDTSIKTASELAKVQNPTLIQYSKENFLAAFLGSKVPNFNLNALLGEVKKANGPSLMYLMSF